MDGGYNIICVDIRISGLQLGHHSQPFVLTDLQQDLRVHLSIDQTLHLHSDCRTQAWVDQQVSVQSSSNLLKRRVRSNLWVQCKTLPVHSSHKYRIACASLIAVEAKCEDKIGARVRRPCVGVEELIVCGQTRNSALSVQAGKQPSYGLCVLTRNERFKRAGLYQGRASNGAKGGRLIDSMGEEH